jgi:ABC-type oligopeptide transport system substrate-binding subunit
VQLDAMRGARAFHQGEADNPAGIGIQAPDERTLIFELEEPATYFIHNLAYYVMLPVPRHVVSARPDDWTRPEHIVSNGPFLLAVWERGEIMILERNPRYHGAFTGNLEQVRLLLNAKPEGQSELYAAGAIDVAMNWFVAGFMMESLQLQFPQEYEKRRQFSTLYYFIDPAGPPFDDRRVRQALAMAINREALADVIKRRYAKPAYGGFIPPGMPGHVPDCCLPFDPVRARELLAQSGFPQGRNFPKTRLLSYPHWADATKFLQDSWLGHLGVEFEAQVITSDLDLKKREQFIGVGGWLADYPDPDNFLRVDVGLTILHWRHETYEGLLDQASKLTDQSERLALYRQAELILAEEACLVPYIYNDFHLMLKPWVKRYPTAAVKNFGFWKDVIVDTDQAP